MYGIPFLGCRRDEEIKALWPQTSPCGAFQLPCTDVDSGHFAKGYATRVCDKDGKWLTPDYSGCAVHKGVGTFALVWMTFSTAIGTSVLRQITRIQYDVSTLLQQSVNLNNMINLRLI